MVKNVNLGYTIIQTFGNYELSRLFPLFWAKDGNLMTLTLSEEDRRVLQRLEEDLWREETRFDISYMDQVMAEDFFEFGRSGRVYNRDEILTAARQPLDAVLPLPDYDVRLLAEDVALATYNSAITYDGVLEKGRRSSIWSRTSNGWMIRFHQGTAYDTPD